MNKIKILLTVALALLISGCGSKMPFKAQEPLANSSLVYMVNHLIDLSQHKKSGFY